MPIFETIQRWPGQVAAALRGHPNPVDGHSSAEDWESQILCRLIEQYNGYRKAGWSQEDAEKKALQGSTAGRRVRAAFYETVRSGNPTRRNTDEIAEAERRFEIFQGRRADALMTVDEPDQARDDLASLGWLIELVFCPRGRNEGKEIDISELAKLRRPKEAETVDWQAVAQVLGLCLVVLNFEHDKVVVASNARGTQLYLIGGNQDVSGALPKFAADDTKDFIELGDLVALTYLASKAQSNFQPIEWEHILGEESGISPFGYWDKLKRRIYLVGGEYRIEEPGIIN